MQRLAVARADRNVLISKKYDLASYVAMSGTVQVSLYEFLGLVGDPQTARYGIPREIMDALAYEVNAHIEKINAHRREEEGKLKLEAEGVSRPLNFGSPNTSLQRIYGG